MCKTQRANLRGLPAVHEVLRTDAARGAIARFGRSAVVTAVRQTLTAARQSGEPATPRDKVADAAIALLEAQARGSLRPVFNLTGIVLHTNLGRAVLADVAVEAGTLAMRAAVALEFELETGRRGERDYHVRGLIQELTGSADATVVNNNAAAILLVLNTLARRREVVVSRGELIEIGAGFRLPEIMRCTGARLREVGTTNRTHAEDYRAAIGSQTGLVLKVHPSNYRIEGFTAEVPITQLALLTRDHGVPLVHDLGSGSLLDTTRFGVPAEPTVAASIAAGVDLVTFSGDKLIGGPQAGIIAGRQELIARINRNPLKRTVRLDKVRLAMLEATLRLYRDPDRLAARLPTLRVLARPKPEIVALAQRLQPLLAGQLGLAWKVAVVDCASQIGSGALPLQTLPSAGLAVRTSKPRSTGRALTALAAALRALPIPVLGRVEGQSLLLDLRCLEAEAAFAENLRGLNGAERAI